MKNPINTLIVDDHPFIIEAYKNAIKKYSLQGHEFNITQANSCQTGYEAILGQAATNPFDLVFFDLSMPQYPEKGIYSGEDLAKVMREKMPECKIMLLTMHTELLKINNIIKEINPSGLIIKNDLTFDELIHAIDLTLNGGQYYSQTVVKLVEEIKNNGVELDMHDRQILLHLSRGVKTKDLPSYIPLSMSAIEKRKLNLKEALNVSGSNDVDLINEAKAKGVI